MNDHEKHLFMLSGPGDCQSAVHQYWNSITGCSICWNTDCNEPRPVVGDSSSTSHRISHLPVVNKLMR